MQLRLELDLELYPPTSGITEARHVCVLNPAEQLFIERSREALCVRRTRVEARLGLGSVLNLIVGAATSDLH